MKNSFSITLLVLATISIISCTKPKVIDPGPTIEESRTVASTWIPMSFSEMTDDAGNIYLQAEATLSGISDVDLSKHADFAYLRFEEDGSTTYLRLPFMYSDDTENFRIEYSVINGVFSVRIFNMSSTSQLTADILQNCKFRLLMISSTDMASIHVDWDDYFAVEDVLNQLDIVSE